MSIPGEASAPAADTEAAAGTAAARRRSPRRTTLVTASLLATVAVIGMAWAAWPTEQSTLTSSVASDQPHAAPTPTPTPTPSASTPPPAATHAPAIPGALAPAEASAQVADFLATAATLAPDAPDTVDQLAKVASGAIVAEIANDQQEFVANGWTQKGTPVVASLIILSADATATWPTAVVQACIDSSDVVTLDSDGTPLAGPGNDHTHRALTLFTLQRNGSSWRVISRTFPDDTTC